MLWASLPAQQLEAEFPGVTDIADSFREGKVEVKLGLKPEARTLGLTLADLARQVTAGAAPGYDQVAAIDAWLAAAEEGAETA